MAIKIGVLEIIMFYIKMWAPAKRGGSPKSSPNDVYCDG